MVVTAVVVVVEKEVVEVEEVVKEAVETAAAAVAAEKAAARVGAAEAALSATSTAIEHLCVHVRDSEHLACTHGQPAQKGRKCRAGARIGIPPVPGCAAEQVQTRYWAGQTAIP